MGTNQSSHLRRSIAGVSVGLGLTLGAAAVLFVRSGVIFGASNITILGFGIAGIILIGAGVLYRDLRSGSASSAQSASSSGTLAESAEGWLGRITAVTGVGVLIASVVTFFAPPTPPYIAVASCPNTRTWASPFIGVTGVDDGVNARTGPSRSYPPTARFPGKCSVGFDGFCLGDGLTDGAASIDGVVEWTDERWLRVARQTDDRLSWLARVLSSESEEPQYIAGVLINPATNFGRLEDLEIQCPQPQFAPPERATLDELELGTEAQPEQRLVAHSAHSANIGFAIYYPGGTAFKNNNYYEQIFNPHGTNADNPGKTDADGSKTVTWPFQATSQENLVPPTTGNYARGTVTVMAIPCYSDNVPANTELAALAQYEISDSGPPTLLSTAPSIGDAKTGDLQLDRLAKTACQAQI